MQLIDRINSKDELLSVRDQLARVLKDRLSMSPGTRKMDEMVADLLGARDFNTAVAKVSEDSQSAESVDLNPLSCDFQRIFCGLCDQGYASEEDVQEMLDDLVFETVGVSQDISDNVNNQGWEVQIQAIINAMGVYFLCHHISELTGVIVEDVKRCLNESAWRRTKGFDLDDLSFDVRGFVGY